MGYLPEMGYHSNHCNNFSSFVSFPVIPLSPDLQIILLYSDANACVDASFSLFCLPAEYHKKVADVDLNVLSFEI